MKIHLSLITPLLTFALLFAACASSEPVAPPSAATPQSPNAQSTPVTSDTAGLAGTKWTLVSWGAPGAETPVVGESPITLEFSADGQMGGSGGCNSYGGFYQTQDDSLLLGEIASTLMACADTALMEQETGYFAALQSVGKFQVSGDQLTIAYEGGVLTFAAAGAAPTEEAAPPTATPAPEAANPDGVVSSSGPSQDFIWHCYTCGGSEVWSFANGQPSRITLPLQVGNFYGYAPATRRVLASTQLPAVGAGPSQISVSDLWGIDTASGQAEPIFSDQVIVEAEWAPDGEHFAYVLATDSTYELRWRSLNGEDRLLASDVAFTFSVSPAGDQVAFTRESAYGLPGQPGLYVVNVASGAEQLVSEADRAGAGSIDDKPVWSPSGQSILLPTYGTTAGPGLLCVAADGSGAVALQFDPALAEVEWYQSEPVSPFWVSDTQFIAAASLAGANAQMGGELSLILYQLNDAVDTIIDGAVLGTGQLIGWDVPGSSIWMLAGVEMQSIPLPTLEG